MTNPKAYPLQNFERFPELAEWIKLLAMTQLPGWSMPDWQHFTDALNAALAQPAAAPVGGMDRHAIDSAALSTAREVLGIALTDRPLVQRKAQIQCVIADAILAVTPGERGTDQITQQNFIRLGITAFKEHELREIIAVFCKLPGIAPPVVAGADRAAVIEECAKVAERLPGFVSCNPTVERYYNKGRTQAGEDVRALVYAGKVGEGK